jgi:2-oxoglutarate ferredoxin oxidoreductase subunit delta
MHHVSVDTDHCKGIEGCGICIWICPTKVFDISDNLTMRGTRPPQVARIADCTGCENCMLYCPDLAIVVVRNTKAKTTHANPER